MPNNNFKQLQAQPFYLAGSGAALGATSIVLKVMADIDGALITMTDLGSKGYGTIEPGAGTQEEAITFTGITQNVNGTATLTGVSTQGFKDPYTQTSGLAKSHAGGTTFVLSNTAGFYQNFLRLDDDNTVADVITFTNPNYPRMDTATPAPTDNEQLATKKYVDDTAFNGAPDGSLTVKGIFQEASQAQIDAGTAAGSTGAQLAVNPSYLATSIYNTQLPTSGQKAALAGTVGTPNGTTNKYVTNTDTDTAATANLLPRRSASGQITVPTTPVATTDAASKSYVDSNTSLNFVGAGSPTANKTYQSYVLPIFAVAATTDAVWALYNLSSTKYQGNYGSSWGPTSGADDMKFTAAVYNQVGTAMTFGTKSITTEFNTILNSVGTDDVAWGLGENANSFVNGYNSAAGKTITFTVDRTTSKLYAHTSNGGGTTDHTETEITGITLTTANTYRIEYIPATSALFYVNGVLKATITTTLPTSSAVLVGWGSKYHGSGSTTNYPTAFSAPNMLIQK